MAFLEERLEDFGAHITVSNLLLEFRATAVLGFIPWDERLKAEVKVEPALESGNAVGAKQSESIVHGSSSD